MRRWAILLVILIGCAPVGQPKPVEPIASGDAVEDAAREFRRDLFADLSRRAARLADTDPGDWSTAAEQWRAEQIEARQAANADLEAAILEAAGEQDGWDRERWRAILMSLSRGWSDG